MRKSTIFFIVFVIVMILIMFFPSLKWLAIPTAVVCLPPVIYFDWIKD